jgi:hypothetical protein
MTQFKITPAWGVYVDFNWSQGGDAMEGSTSSQRY